LEYTRGLLYQAAGRHEEALQWFEEAFTRLKAVASRSAYENSLLKWCEKAVKETRKMLKH
jgi:tetratricopeptide (TPR) repeat protein